ncbi:MAG: cell division ATPase MinD [Candidatus Aenigmarchaeota archaeon]|nr:cell division ATPase MinD [Candidatus Aenigmarchaeota archaeon]
MTRIIVFSSGKGGVGKTTLVSNLAAALADFGEEVVAIDANVTTPNLGLHLGIHLAPNTLHDVLKGNVKLRNAIYPHPLGFKVVPASLNVNDLKSVDVGRLPEVTLNLLGKADFVILDCAAGLGKEASSALMAADEVIIVTNPDLPSLTDALKTLKIAQEAKKKVLGIVVNRVKGRKHELSKEEIEEFLGVPVIAEIPEDKHVSEAIAAKQPLVHYKPDSPAAREIRKLAAWLAGRKVEEEGGVLRKLLRKVTSWLS